MSTDIFLDEKQSLSDVDEDFDSQLCCTRRVKEGWGSGRPELRSLTANGSLISTGSVGRYHLVDYIFHKGCFSLWIKLAIFNPLDGVSNCVKQCQVREEFHCPPSRNSLMMRMTLMLLLFLFCGNCSVLAVVCGMSFSTLLITNAPAE